jgi:hypothetical protein
MIAEIPPAISGFISTKSEILNRHAASAPDPDERERERAERWLGIMACQGGGTILSGAVIVRGAWANSRTGCRPPSR